jgi:transcriptional regulator of acetoin/glycerol metabolism
VLLSQGDAIEAVDLALTAGAGAAAPQGNRSLDELEREAIREALARHDGNVSLAARVLGLSRSALYRRMQRYGIPSRE